MELVILFSEGTRSTVAESFLFGIGCWEVVSGCAGLGIWGRRANVTLLGVLDGRSEVGRLCSFSCCSGERLLSLGRQASCCSGVEVAVLVHSVGMSMFGGERFVVWRLHFDGLQRV